MATVYTEVPENFSEIESFTENGIDSVKTVFFSAERVFFYDACSFQRHSHLDDHEQQILIGFFKKHRSVLFITRCILMELVSDRRYLPEEYIRYIKNANAGGVTVVIFNEEYTSDLLSECFSTKERVNQYLIWAVRAARSPVSTIHDTLMADKKLASEVIEGKDASKSDLYRRFFTAVRSNKEHSDNLGEELIAICIHILSNLPGLADGKLCVITDDKWAAGKIDSVTKRALPPGGAAGIILFSTPKLVQHIYAETEGLAEEEMIRLISQGVSGNIVVMGLTPYDLKVRDKISLSCRDLVREIMAPNGIKIVF